MTSREEFEQDIKLRLTSNASDFDQIVVDMLKELERLNARVKELEHEDAEKMFYDATIGIMEDTK